MIQDRINKARETERLILGEACDLTVTNSIPAATGLSMVPSQ